MFKQIPACLRDRVDFHRRIIFTCVSQGRSVNKIEAVNGWSRVNVKAEKVYVTTFRTLPLFLSYFEENSSYVNGLSVCLFVALWLCVFGCLLQGPKMLKVDILNSASRILQSWSYYLKIKVEGTMSWCLGTNEMLALRKVKQGHFENAILILHNFFVFYYS